MSDADTFTGSVLDDGLLEPPDDIVYSGRSTWSRVTVDTAVLEQSFDQRLVVALRKSAGIFRAAFMDHSAQLLIEAAKTIERLEDLHD